MGACPEDAPSLDAPDQYRVKTVFPLRFVELNVLGKVLRILRIYDGLSKALQHMGQSTLNASVGYHGNTFVRGLYLPQTCQMKWTFVVTGTFQDMNWKLVPRYVPGRQLRDSVCPPEHHCAGNLHGEPFPTRMKTVL